ncbi:MAG: response regulator transcription factor [Bacteroidia bacterium]|nr:response regulator transcription factor [Bacteroidia bacterium]
MAKTAKKKSGKTELTARELKVITLVCRDKSNVEIAKAMGMSASWVDYCKAGIYRKINRNTPIGMAMYAVKNGLVEAK